MMAQPSDHAAEPVSPSCSVIGPQFIVPHPLEVIVEAYPCRNIVITDTDHKILFKVKRCNTSFHRQRLLLNANDETIVTLREKKLSTHKRWVAFRGESKAGSDMIFSTKTEHVIQFKTHVNVMLANKSSSKEDCDLKIEGSWSKRNCIVHMGDSSTTIAQMHKPQTSKKMKSGEDKFTVTIQPNMDYAFMVSLFAIIDAMENPDKKKGYSRVVRLAVNVISANNSVLSYLNRNIAIAATNSPFRWTRAEIDAYVTSCLCATLSSSSVNLVIKILSASKL
ncbi:hypothetical protein L1987_03122 [Smallanthus sonchifolius]|uniref:Uncharacterized protein n=1 Tax=Smallanthus sonchifolius TaxID=185202 RepID=A0ACB9K9T9_9ASTR|nr:hypothetical protein L1987_03122 [Smallanthus sonchifolius]